MPCLAVGQKTWSSTVVDQVVNRQVEMIVFVRDLMFV